MIPTDEDAEARVAEFYGTVGWESEGAVTEDARRWEDLRQHAASYVSRCRLRVTNHIPERGRCLLLSDPRDDPMHKYRQLPNILPVAFRLP